MRQEIFVFEKARETAPRTQARLPVPRIQAAKVRRKARARKWSCAGRKVISRSRVSDERRRVRKTNLRTAPSRQERKEKQLERRKNEEETEQHLGIEL